jgi:hypothetical protein
VIVWSYGGGVQTAAIAVLIVTGKLPRPDRAVMADTGREAAATWRYLYNVMAPYLDGVGLKVELATHDLATVDLYGKNGDLLIPAFTEHGRLPTFCSVEWKRRPVRRYLRAAGVTACDLWLGITIDEVERAKTSGADWIRHVYPLLTMVPMRRSECLALVERAGLPTPPRSSCWMCPHRGNDQWRALDADELVAAAALEQDMRARDSGVWLHRSRMPIASGPFVSDASAQLGLCDGGFCWT